MKALMLHQFFNTPQDKGGLRSYYLGKALVDSGVNVVVITTHNKPIPVTAQIEGMEVHYLPVTYRNHFGFFKRVYSFFQFVLHIVSEAGKFKDADVCYAISAPLTTGLAAIWIKRRFGIPYLFEVGDLWPEAPIQLGIVRNSILKWILYGMEKRIYKNAKAVVALSAAIRGNIEKRVTGLRIHLLPNMADTEFYKPEPKRPDLEAKFSVQSKFVISYIGTMGMANGLEYVVECAEAAQEKKAAIHFLLCGGGAVLERLKQLSAQKSLSNLSFIPPQDREGVREVMNVTDAMLVSYKPLPVLETGSPHKYFDGLAAGKLMIVNVKGWMKEEVEKNGCGIAVDAGDANDLLTKVAPIISSPDRLNAYQAASRKLAERLYSRKLLGEMFSRLFV